MKDRLVRNRGHQFPLFMVHCRKMLGLTQEELATRLGVSLSSIQHWETGLDGISNIRLEKFCSIINKKKVKLWDMSRKPAVKERRWDLNSRHELGWKRK